jgi:hypothetical protein
MAEFFTTSGLSSKIEEIINKSEKFLIVASPFLNLSERYQKCLNLASKRGVDIRFLYGKDSIKSEYTKAVQQKAFDFLNTLENCKLIEVEPLHAKCFLNEDSIIIGSMNLYSYSEANNYEMGVLLSRRSDREAYKNALQEVSSYISHYGDNDTIFNPEEKEIRVGFCIHCAEEILYNKRRPYCGECYNNANPYNYPDKKEKYCHGCGEQYNSSFRNPISSGCKTEKTKKILESKF